MFHIIYLFFSQSWIWIWNQIFSISLVVGFQNGIKEQLLNSFILPAGLKTDFHLHFSKQVAVVNTLHNLIVCQFSHLFICCAKILNRIFKAVKRLEFDDQKLKEYFHVLFVSNDQAHIMAIFECD